MPVESEKWRPPNLRLSKDKKSWDFAEDAGGRSCLSFPLYNILEWQKKLRVSQKISLNPDSG